jgi:multiple sugar transport system permease protein
VRRPETRAAYAFISPWILGFVFFTAGPVLATLVLSMTEYDVLTRPEWIGFGNYRDAMASPDTGHALKNTATYALMYVPSSMALGLALALLLQRAGRATGLMRTLMYLPVMTPPVATAVLFLLLLNGQNGLVNEVSARSGCPRRTGPRILTG